MLLSSIGDLRKVLGVCVVRVVVVRPEATSKVILANAGVCLLCPRNLTAVREVVFDDVRAGRHGDAGRVLLLYPVTREPDCVGSTAGSTSD